MKPAEFPEHNTIFGKNQDDVIDLPAHVDSQGVATFCFELNKEEIEQVKKTGKIYPQIFTGGRPLQPIGVSVLNPFEETNHEE